MTNLEFRFFHAYGTDEVSLPVVLKSADRVANVLATIDTGSSHCVFQRLYGEALDLNIEAGERKMFRSAGGPVETFGHLVEIGAIDQSFESLVYFLVDPEIHKNLLGRNGWLDRVRLGVVHYDRELHISPYDS